MKKNLLYLILHRRMSSEKKNFVRPFKMKCFKVKIQNRTLQGTRHPTLTPTPDRGKLQIFFQSQDFGGFLLFYPIYFFNTHTIGDMPLYILALMHAKAEVSCSCCMYLMYSVLETISPKILPWLFDW